MGGNWLNRQDPGVSTDILIDATPEDVSMHPTEGLATVLVPKHYRARSVLIEDAFRALLNLKPWLKVELSIELYLMGDISLSRAAEMAGVDIESFKEMLKSRGLKVSSYIGSEEAIEGGLRLI